MHLNTDMDSIFFQFLSRIEIKDPPSWARRMGIDSIDTFLVLATDGQPIGDDGIQKRLIQSAVSHIAILKNRYPNLSYQDIAQHISKIDWDHQDAWERSILLQSDCLQDEHVNPEEAPKTKKPNHGEDEMLDSFGDLVEKFQNHGSERKGGLLDKEELLELARKLHGTCWELKTSESGNVVELVVASNFSVQFPPEIVYALHVHQREGIEWTMHRFKKGIGGLLSDDMGMGTDDYVVILS